MNATISKTCNEPAQEAASGETGVDPDSCMNMSACIYVRAYVCLFVLRFYGPVNPMGSCRARSVYLTTRLLGRLSPLSG